MIEKKIICPRCNKVTKSNFGSNPPSSYTTNCCNCLAFILYDDGSVSDLNIGSIKSKVDYGDYDEMEEFLDDILDGRRERRKVKRRKKRRDDY